MNQKEFRTKFSHPTPELPVFRGGVGPAAFTAMYSASRSEGSELFQVDSSSIKNILEYRKDFNH